MSRERWILGSVAGVLLFWVLGALLGPSPHVAEVTLTHESPQLSPRRLSASGTDYGRCDGVTLTVLLYPEPCGWDHPLRHHLVAGR